MTDERGRVCAYFIFVHFTGLARAALSRVAGVKIPEFRTPRDYTRPEKSHSYVNARDGSGRSTKAHLRGARDPSKTRVIVLKANRCVPTERGKNDVRILSLNAALPQCCYRGAARFPAVSKRRVTRFGFT